MLAILFLCLFYSLKLFLKKKIQKQKKKAGIMKCYQVGDKTNFFWFSIKTNKCPLFISFVGYV